MRAPARLITPGSMRLARVLLALLLLCPTAAARDFLCAEIGDVCHCRGIVLYGRRRAPLSNLVLYPHASLHNPDRIALAVKCRTETFQHAGIHPGQLALQAVRGMNASSSTKVDASLLGWGLRGQKIDLATVSVEAARSFRLESTAKACVCREHDESRSRPKPSEPPLPSRTPTHRQRLDAADLALVNGFVWSVSSPAALHDASGSFRTRRYQQRPSCTDPRPEKNAGCCYRTDLRTRLASMAEWSAHPAQGLPQTLPVLYPYSGVDLVTAAGLFPRAPAYFLCAYHPSFMPAFYPSDAAARASAQAAARAAAGVPPLAMPPPPPPPPYPRTAHGSTDLFRATRDCLQNESHHNHRNLTAKRGCMRDMHDAAHMWHAHVMCLGGPRTHRATRLPIHPPTPTPHRASFGREGRLACMTRPVLPFVQP